VIKILNECNSALFQIFTDKELMTEKQLTTTQIPVNNLINMLAAIRNRNYPKFQELENAFVTQHSEESGKKFLTFGFYQH